MTVTELIEQLLTMGDKHWRDTAVVKIVHDDNDEEFIDAIVDPFNVKYSSNSADIHV